MRPPAHPGSRDPRLPAIGATLVRSDRLGRRCEVAVEAEGFRFRDTLYPSLSAAASAAATELGLNSNVNGYAFFGLTRPVRSARSAAERLRQIASRYEEQAATLLREHTADESRIDIRRAVEAHAAHLTTLLARSAA